VLHQHSHLTKISGLIGIGFDTFNAKYYNSAQEFDFWATRPVCGSRQNAREREL